MTGTLPAPDARRARRLRSDDGRLVRGRRSRDRIRAAARELFRERGFDGSTLRAIGERAGMGASSIYRHVRSKHELLVLELSDLQEEAWLAFRRADDRAMPTRERVRRFFEAQHALYAEDADLVVIALRATTYPEAPVARRALALQDRAIALITEILQSGRRDLSPELDPLAAARALFHIASGVRISWANGLVSEKSCRRAVDEAVELMFRGLAPSRPPPPDSTD
jgi:AcrR family transcriptional regulator